MHVWILVCVGEREGVAWCWVCAERGRGMVMVCAEGRGMVMGLC